MPQDSVELAREGIDVMNRRDLRRMLALFHPDAEIDWTRSRGPLSGIYRGHDGLRQIASEFWETFGEVRIEAHEFIDAGSDVVIPNTAHFRGRDGVEAIARSTFVYSVQDGRLTRLRLFQEHAEALEAVGLREPSG